MSDRPNVLLVCTDQQFAGAMSCAGNGELETPAMDRIAANGTRFDNAYCTDPVCSPSRASMLTGRMPHEVGVTTVGSDGFDEDYEGPMLGRLFDDAGYETAYAGKWHVGPVTLPEGGAFGFDRLLPGWFDGDVADAAVEFLREDPDRPFFLTASFTDPHDICEWARGGDTPHGAPDDAPIEECPPLPENFAVPPFEPECIREAVEDPDWYRGIGAMKNADPDEWRRYRHAYYRMVERVDRRVGRVLDALEASGAAENTVVVFLSDHGDGAGAHQLNQKLFLYEESVRVPFIVDAPGSPGGRVDDRLVSTGLDLLPTLCDYAGIEVDEGLRGHSVREAVAGDEPGDWREHLVAETHNPFEGRMIRTDRYKYVVYETGARREQLFDVEADPGELVDLSEHAGHRDVLTDLRETLSERCVATGDTSDTWVIPGTEGFPGHVDADTAQRR